MKAVNKKIDEIMDWEKIIDRLKTVENVSCQKDVAEKIGLGETDFSNRKNKGSLLQYLIRWVLHERVNLNIHWLLTGNGEIYNKDRTDGGVTAEVQKLLEKARKVLMSGNLKFSGALKWNIEAFSEALDTVNNIDSLNDEVRQLKEKVAALEEKGKEKPPPRGESQRKEVM